jgi:hypothetical protein
MTNEGEILSISSNYEETSPLPDSFLGHHEICLGLIKARRVSKCSKILLCDRCGLRVYFPAHVGTLEELNNFLHKKLDLLLGGLD